jgi:hypothetical protein
MNYWSPNEVNATIATPWNVSANHLARNANELLSLCARVVEMNSNLGAMWRSSAEPVNLEDTVKNLLSNAVNGKLKNLSEKCIVNRQGRNVVVSFPCSASYHWLREALKIGDIVPSPSLIAEQFTWMDGEIIRQEWSSFDRLFQSMDTKRLNTTCLLTLLRGTFSVRAKIKEWMRFKSEVSETLNNRSLDASALMRGL